jgi:hypothetical protein
MRFSEFFQLGKGQGELDFVDVQLETDTPLFVDPYALATGTDDWSRKCGASVSSYFQSLVEALRAGNVNRANYLASHLHEPNETRLGLSLGRPSGRGVGGAQAHSLLTALSQSTAVQTGFVEDLADCELMVDGIGPDKISDVTTNVIREQLIAYTQEQCSLLGIPMRRDVASGALWQPNQGEWIERYEPLPVVDGSKVLLVPKRSVRWHVLLQHGEYYRHFVLNYLQANAEEIPNLGSLARGRGGRVSKKTLEEAFPLSKEFLLQFSRAHPELLREYKETKAAIRPISNAELDGDFDPIDLARHLIQQLRAIPTGRENATRFHHLGAGIFSFLFYPNLITPKLEAEINDGRRRIDVTYVNTAQSGLFRRFTPTTQRSSGKIVVEFKNYEDDPGNPEVDQVLGRFADHRGWLGFLVSRTIDDRNRLEARCRDLARDHRAYIVPLCDADLTTMLEAVIRNDHLGVEQYLGARFDALTR